ncbi:MAG TPA: amino acid adenylation domain-containing protein, partial [Pseudonocardiaceae bacterium]
WSSGPVTAAGAAPGLAHDAFEAAAAVTPHAIAITEDGAVTTYGELDGAANRLAHHLRDLGVGPGALVGVCLERSVAQVTAMIAVHKAGGGYLPLEPGYPAERLALMVADAAPALVITRRGLPVPGGLPAARVVLTEDAAAWADRPATAPRATAAPDDVAYVIYTSGSTGRPKGAVVTHRALVNRVAYVGPRQYRLAPGAAMLQKTEIGFDVSPGEVYAPLSAGARVVVARAGGHRDPAYLRDLMIAERVTVVHLVPAVLAALLTEGMQRCTELRSVCVGGEEIPVDVARAFLAALPWCELHNTYGPAEAAIDVTAWECTAAALAGQPRVPLGGPHPNVRVHVLDADLRPVPVGAPGELCVAGAGLGRGYHGAPDLTADRFVPDPFGPPGSRLYRTGDAAAWRAGGVVDFLGRLDSQVKLRGVRVELGEVEAALRTCPGVLDAVATVHRDGGRQVLVAHVRTTGGAVDPVALRARLRESLPDQLVPAAFVPLAAVPLDANGKVDRRRLPAPGPDAYAAGVYVAPDGPDETAVAEVWARALGLERVGVDDSFFDLGGDSMLAVAVVGALRAAGYVTSVRDVLATRTVRGLAATLTAADPAGPGTVAPFALLTGAERAALPAGLADAYPASWTQLGMLVEQQVSGDRAAYHSVVSHRVRGERPFDAAALRAAVAFVVGRHEVLRTSFRITGHDRPLQFVHAAAEAPVTVVDGRHLDAAAGRALLEEHLAAERGTPFDVTAAPLLRVAGHVADDRTWWLTLTVCHAITEGWSAALLVTELLAAYAAFAAGGRPDAPPLPAVRYAGVVAGELAALDSAADRAHWADVVARHAVFTLPAGWGDPAAPRRPVTATVPFADLADRLRGLATATRVSLKAVLHAAHLKVLGQLTADEAFHAGLVCDARPELLGADRVHGMYLNTLPFPHDRSARTWRELVTAVFGTELSLWPHRRYPLAAVQREAGRGLVRVMFNYQDFTRATGDRGGDGTTVDATAGSGGTEFALAVYAQGDRYELVSGSTDLTPANLRRIAAMYRAVLEAMVADPDGDAQAPCLPPAERQAAAGGSGAAEALPPVELRLEQVFALRAAERPDAVAVRVGTDLRYAEVDAEADRLARRLRAAGVGQESVVGVCLEHGPELVPALLGVLRAGGAYLPLDPAQPAERIAFMLADSGARVVVTTADLATAVAGHPTVLVGPGAPAADTDTGTGGLPPDVGGPDRLAYVIYTSGSTGRPKGVGVTHENVLRLLDAAQEHYAADETDVWALTHSYAFDVSVWELWGALLHGGRLVVVPRPVTRVPDELLDLLVAERVSMLAHTPTAFRGLVALAAAGDPRVDRLALRAVVLAGERLDLADLAPWADRVGLARTALVNMYGITETTVYSTYHRVSRADLRAGAGSRIGRPLSGVRLHVLDGNGHPVPAGVPGEIHLGGHGVARGYLGRPDLTAARFLPDPFGGEPGARLYRTGDIGRLLPDGTVEFIGRADGQVKIRGHRVELGEIEVALAAVPGVGEAAVLLREDRPG